jgi:3-deoxy-D-manno-octulosonic-acid transferase
MRTCNPLSAIVVYGYSGILEALRYACIPLIARSRQARKWRLRERLLLPTADSPINGRGMVWLHAASLGESKLLCRFLTLLEHKHPEDRYVLTAATAHGVDHLRTHRTAAVAAVGFLPYDTLSLMHAMLKRFTITRLWLMETELWPSLLWACWRRRVSVGIVNGRLEAKSLAGYARVKILLGPLIHDIRPVFVQDQTYAGRFAALGIPVENLVVTGNLKSMIWIHQEPPARSSEVRRALSIAPEETVITVGCLHPGEAAVIRSACRAAREKGFAWRWVIVPRHPEKCAEIRAALGTEDVVSVKSLVCSPGWRICCVEGYGMLEDCYMIAAAAVVGGTFVDIGGHNMWEAAQFGLPVVFGPFCHTQRESCDKLISSGAGFCVGDGPDLAHILVRLLTVDKTAVAAAIDALRREVNARTHSFQELIP